MAKTLTKLGKKVKKYGKKAGKVIKSKAEDAIDVKQHVKAVKSKAKNLGQVALNNIEVPLTAVAHNVKYSAKYAPEVAGAVADTVAHPSNWKKNIVKTAKSISNDKEFWKDEKKLLKKEGKAILQGRQAVGDIIAGVDPRRQVIMKDGQGTVDKYIKKGFDKVKKLINHPEWYGKYPEYITTNLNWGSRKEALIGLENIVIGARISIHQMIPLKHGTTSQAYIDAINAIYIKLRGSNSGAFNYAASDVAAYLECVRGILMAVWKLQRDIKLVNEVQIYQSQTPDSLLRLAGYTAAQITDLKGNRAIYISRLNQMADRINNTFPLPPQMTVFERAKYISQTIIKESDAYKTSYFIYSPTSVVKANSGVDLYYVHTLSTGSFNDRLNEVDSLITAALAYNNANYGTDTFIKIAGDMLKAYGNNALQKPLEYVEEHDRPVFIYDDYSLEQIQNAAVYTKNISLTNHGSAGTPFGIVASNLGLTLSLDGATNTYATSSLEGVKTTSYSNSCKELIVTTHKNEVSGLVAISLTRLCPTIYLDAATGTFGANVTGAISECGTEIASDFRLVYYDRANNAVSDNGLRACQQSTNNAGLRAALWSQLDFAPAYALFESGNSPASNTLIDLDNYTKLTNDQIIAFNDVAVFSEYKTVDIQDQVNFKAVKH